VLEFQHNKDEHLWAAQQTPLDFYQVINQKKLNQFSLIALDIYY